MIRRDYASDRQPGPVARPAPAPRPGAWERLAWGLVPGLLLGALAGWLLLGRHSREPAAASAAAPAAAPAAKTATLVRVALPPPQPSTYTFYGLLTRDKASQQVAASPPPKQP